VLLRGFVGYRPPPRRAKAKPSRPEISTPQLPEPFDPQAENRLPPEIREARKQMREEKVKAWMEWKRTQSA